MRLKVDAATANVLARFERAGVHPLLLKGASIVQWLYADGTERPYADCDLLVGPTDVDGAERALQSLGYVPLLDRWGMPAWWYGHAVVWTRRGGEGPSVDLHRTLIGVGVDHARAWRVLSAGSEEVVVAGRRTPCLGLPARAMYVALHAAQHGPGTQPSVDLERALAQTDVGLWSAAASVAAELDATAGFVAGLRLASAGVGLITRLGLPDARAVATELRAGTPPPLALGFEQLARAPTLRARAEIVWRNLAPNPALLRSADPRTARSRWGLARFYLRRLLWLARHAPRGFQAWYRARRSVRREDR